MLCCVSVFVRFLLVVRCRYVKRIWFWCNVVVFFVSGFFIFMIIFVCLKILVGVEVIDVLNFL